MSVLHRCFSLLRRYGPATRVVVTNVLNVLAPGSARLIDLVGGVIEAAGECAEEISHEQWERDIAAKLGQTHSDVEQIGELLKCFEGPLTRVCDQVAAHADQIDRLPAIVAQVIAADPSLSQVVHRVNDIKEAINTFKSDIARLAEGQDEARAVFVRMHRVADYFDELWHLGIKPAEFARLLAERAEVTKCVERGNFVHVDDRIRAIHERVPNSASTAMLEAAAGFRRRDYAQVGRALTLASRLTPGDQELRSLSLRVTKRLSQHTPPSSNVGPQTARADALLQPGDTLDGWHLEICVGYGGWGQVFRARRAGEVRALKVMHPELAKQRDFVQRFKKEIFALQRLPRHPNLVRIDDFGYCDEKKLWYLAMEYLDGPTLESFLAAKGPLTETQVWKVFPPVLEGLAKAHALGIVHRDIKPGNMIFRRSDQCLVLADFGLAVDQLEIGHTRIGGLTTLFAATEQLYGEAGT
ncbi:MAG: serine/threonine protein kinase, partial [Gemmataceae bacterium]|nr:serine/threonine protein kinase [Gemmataceae bacterium]